MRILSVVVVATSFALAAQAATPPRSKQPAGPPAAIAALFKPDMLGANRAFVERRLGPAKYVEDGVRTYLVGGCRVEITYERDSVRSVGLQELSNTCTFDLASFFPSVKLGSAAQVTFGRFSTAFRTAKYLPECIGSCGNAADPSLTAYYAGSHAEGFYEIQIGNAYPYRGAAADPAFDALLDASRAKRYADPLYNPDCEAVTALTARSAFVNVQAKSIKVGFGLDENPARCDR